MKKLNADLIAMLLIGLIATAEARVSKHTPKPQEATHHYEYFECPAGFHYHPVAFKYENKVVGDGRCHSNYRDLEAKPYVATTNGSK